MNRLAAVAVALLLVALFMGADDIATAFRSTAPPEADTLILEEIERDPQSIDRTEAGARQVELGILPAGVDPVDQDEQAPQLNKPEVAVPPPAATTADDDPAHDNDIERPAGDDDEETDDNEADRDDAAGAEDDVGEEEEEEEEDDDDDDDDDDDEDSDSENDGEGDDGEPDL